MALFGRIRRRLALALLLTALIPLLAAVLLAASMLRQATARFYVPEVGVRLDQSLSLYQELARALKTSMRLAAAAIAAREPLRQAARNEDVAAMRRELERALSEYPQLVSLSVYDDQDRELVQVNRGHPVDEAKENKLEVMRSLGDPNADPKGVAAEALPDPAEEDAAGPRLVAVFAADKARFEELEQMSQFVDTYKQLERRRASDESSYVYAFALLLGITIIAAIGVGALFARGVSSRLGELSLATQRVAAGDLTIRVPEYGKDEISDLAKAFNRMLGEVENSRARIEYLQRIAAWQEMARRLAHEIKNPLTPIQLAVQEIHRRYPDTDPAYKKLLDSTLEIVEDEVLTLRRLVSEFSGFARLPQAELERADLGEFLKEQSVRLSMPDEDEPGTADELRDHGSGAVPWAGFKLAFEIPPKAAPVYLDRHMFRRALINLVRNAAQAIHGAGRAEGVIAIRLGRNADYHVLDIDDDGPGIPSELGSAVFDPYVTTKNDGTGLGLAIVKKIVVEHGGTIAAQSSPLGGARMRILLPVLGTKASAALEQRDWQGPPSSSRASRRPAFRVEHS
jgi:two-component system, NtrC family, nitrogen regulation sensor histidine kinase NtrY